MQYISFFILSVTIILMVIEIDKLKREIKNVRNLVIGCCMQKAEANREKLEKSKGGDDVKRNR